MGGLRFHVLDTLPTSNPTNISHVWDMRNFQGYVDAAVIRLNPYYRSSTDLNRLALEFRAAIWGMFDDGMMLSTPTGPTTSGLRLCDRLGYNHGIAMPCPANTNTWEVWFRTPGQQLYFVRQYDDSASIMERT